MGVSLKDEWDGLDSETRTWLLEHPGCPVLPPAMSAKFCKDPRGDIELANSIWTPSPGPWAWPETPSPRHAPNPTPTSASNPGSRRWMLLDLALSFQRQDALAGSAETSTALGRGRLAGEATPHDPARFLVPREKRCLAGRLEFFLSAHYARTSWP